MFGLQARFSLATIQDMRQAYLGCFLLLFTCVQSQAQDINEQKKVVAFAFGTVHPRNRDGTPVKNAAGAPLEVEAPLGTVFFVGYPDARGGPDFGFFYVVTAKHVLKDADGSFLKEIKLRLNRKEPNGGSSVEFIGPVPVTDAQGRPIWFQDPSDDAVDVAAYPLAPNQQRFDFTSIHVSMFADGNTIKTERVAEGDLLYFIGLMAQYYGDLKNYPVVRRGALGILTDEKIETPTGRQHAFIAELTSWPGNSGSPVFLNLAGLRGGNLTVGTNLKFLGILSGSFLNRSRGTVLNSDTFISGNDFNTGVSFIIPAERVKAVLDSPAAQANRDAVVKKRFGK